MDLLALIKKRRSIRKFKSKSLSRESLLNLIEAACFAHSICNRQRLHFWIITDPQIVDVVYQHSCIGSPHDGDTGLTPANAAPPVYIAISVKGAPSNADHADVGAAYQNMALMSLELGLGLFWIHAFSEEMIKGFSPISEEQSILSLVAVGAPAENPVAINIDPSEAEHYYNLNETHTTIPKLKTKYMVSWC
jgi:nitroreductase